MSKKQIKPPKGHVFTCMDYTAIEARIVAFIKDNSQSKFKHQGVQTGRISPKPDMQFLKKSKKGDKI